jgi:transcriptional regulator with XRE-family HTH domain
MVLIAEQVRAARGLLNWSAQNLAKAANLGLSTIQRFEGGGVITAANLAAIRSALEAAGVEFIPENGGGAGVRLKKQDRNN